MNLMDKLTESLVDKLSTNETENHKMCESVEKVTTLYDLIVKRGEGIDIIDLEYDMMVYIDFDEESTDSYDEYIKSLCKQLHCVKYDDNTATVDMYKYVENNFDKLESIFDVMGDSKEECLESLVCDVMPGVISGYTTDSIYKQLMESKKVTESMDKFGKKVSEEGACELYNVKDNEYVIIISGQEMKRFNASSLDKAVTTLKKYANTPSTKMDLK